MEGDAPVQFKSLTPPSWPRVGRRLAIALFLLLVLGSCEQREDYCLDCLSLQSSTNVGLGAWDRAPLLTLVPISHVATSKTYQALFDAGHVHEWRKYRHNLIGVLGFGYPLANFGGTRNAFTYAMEESDRLRDFVKSEVSAGRVTRAEVVQMIRLRNRLGFDSPSDKAARKRAFEWMKTHAPECSDYNMDARDH